MLKLLGFISDQGIVLQNIVLYFYFLVSNIMRSLPPLTALKVFETAGKHLSFTEAAKQLHVTQGAVSRQIKQLEDYLGVPLFIRLHHKMELTVSGAALLAKLELSFDLMEEAIVDIKGASHRQKLNICAPPTYATRWLAPLLQDFYQHYPELEIAIHNEASEHIIFDCVIRFGTEPKPRYQSELLMQERHAAICSPALVSKAQPFTLQSGNLLHNFHQGRRLPVWVKWLQDAGIEGDLNSAKHMEFSTLDQVINAVKNGAGYAIIDKNMIAQELADGSLVAFSDIEVHGEFGYWLDITGERQGLSKVQHFSQWLKNQD